MSTRYLKALLFFILFISNIDLCLSQTLEWVKTIGGINNDWGYSIAIDTAGNVYSTGNFKETADFDSGPGTNFLVSAGLEDIFICKHDSTGNLLWAKNIGGIGIDAGYSIALDTFNNVYVIGSFEGVVDFDPGVLEYNITSFGNSDIFIIKLDTDGNLKWVNQVGGTDYDEGYSIKVDVFGNIYATGSFRDIADFSFGLGSNFLTSAGLDDIFICKIDSLGNSIWAKRIGGNNFDYPNSMTVDASGNVYTTGSSYGIVDFDPGPGIYNLTGTGSSFICKLNSSGGFLWANRTDVNTTNAITVDNFGHIYTTGSFSNMHDFDPGTNSFIMTSVGLDDCYISKFDVSGNFEWAKQFGGMSLDFGEDIETDLNGNIYSIGRFRDISDFDPDTGSFVINSAGSYDVYISKIDASGNFVWARNIGGTSDEFGYNIKIDSKEYIYVIGSFREEVDFDMNTSEHNLSSNGSNDVFISKYCQPFKIISQSTDTVICYGDSITFNVTLGGIFPFNYQWRRNGIDISGANSESYSILSVSMSDEGLYTCVVSNEYNSDTTFDAELKVIKITANAGLDTIICKGQNNQLNAIGNSNYSVLSGTLNYNWSPALGLNDVNISNPLANPVANTIYVVNITDELGCSSSDQVEIFVSNVFQDEAICIVTVDTISWKNEILWEKTFGVGTDYFVIYKDTGSNNYCQIGNIAFDQITKIIDTSSIPELQSDKYKISVIDTCGNESELSDFHKTIHLDISANANTMLLNWEGYIDESGTFLPMQYYVYRGTLLSNMILLDSVSGSTNFYNDSNIFSVYKYIVSAKKSNGCNNLSNVISYSNLVDNNDFIGIEEILYGRIDISPNPFSESTTISIPNLQISKRNANIKISDITGNTIRVIPVVFDLNKNQSVYKINIHRENLISGIYFIELYGDILYRGKLIVK